MVLNTFDIIDVETVSSITIYAQKDTWNGIGGDRLDPVTVYLNPEDVSVEQLEGKLITEIGLAHATLKPQYIVTYTDGVDNEVVFEDQITTVEAGQPTPPFSEDGTVPTREDYKFTGWDPEVAKTVTENATYIAQWELVKSITFTYETGENGQISGVKTETIKQDENGKANPKDIPDAYGDAGYEFAGWEIKGHTGMPLLSTEILKTTKFSEDTTFVAVFKKSAAKSIVFTYEVEENGQINGVKTETIEQNENGKASPKDIPDAYGNPGYEFAGWQIKGAEGMPLLSTEILKTTKFDEDTTFVAEFREKPSEERTVEVTFTVNPEYGSFTEYDEGPVTFKNISEFSTEQFEVPEVTAKEGYKFVGWKGQGADVIEWDADASTFGVSGLCYFPEGSDVGYASIEAVFELVEPEQRYANVYFTVNPEYGSFTEYGIGPVMFQNIAEDSTQEFEVPEITAKEGYKFVGWKGQGADKIKWDADVSTFVVSGLCYFPEGSNVGYASIEAVFEPVSYVAEVTFKVRNGSWNNGTSADIIKNFELDSEDDTYTLTEDDIPSVGREPDRGYERGEWRTDPEGAEVGVDGATFIYIYDEEETSGGGAHHPEAGGGGNNDRDDDDDTEEIIDEEVPLAETPWLNTEDHYAYIVGYSEDGTVRPNANITRAEVSTIFFRLLTDNARDQFWMTSNNFSDVLPNDWYNTAVSTMVNMGIIQGYEDGTFRPDAAITRAEAVTMVNNVLGRKPDADHMLDSMIKWTDNMDTSAWYYEAILEATNSHDYDLFEDAEYETWTALQENRDWAALEKDWANAHVA